LNVSVLCSLFKLVGLKTYDAPVTEGESYDVTIEDLAREGDGVARIEGFVIFVPGTKVGDSVKIKVEKRSQL